MRNMDPAELANQTREKIELRETKDGQLLPFLRGVMLPGVQTVEVITDARDVRTCEITIKLFGPDFELLSHRVGGQDWSDADEPRGAILR